MATDEQIGLRLAQLREDEFQTSQAEFSAILQEGGLNWSQGTLSKVEAGKRAIRLIEAKQLAEILEIPITFLFQDPDYLTNLRKETTRDLDARRVRLEISTKEHAAAQVRFQAVQVLEDLRRGKRGKVRVHGCDALHLLRFVIGEIYAPINPELRALLKSLNNEGIAMEALTWATNAIHLWLDNPDEPPQLITDTPLSPAERRRLLDLYDFADDGDEDAIDYLIDEEFELRLAVEVQILLESHGIEFVPPFGTEPTKIEGATNG